MQKFMSVTAGMQMIMHFRAIQSIPYKNQIAIQKINQNVATLDLTFCCVTVDKCVLAYC
jgi:hypothetical protein